MVNLDNPMNYSEAEMGSAATAHVNLGLTFTLDVSGMTREEMAEAMSAKAYEINQVITDAAQAAAPEVRPYATTPKLAHATVFDGDGRLIRMMDVTTGADL